MSDKVDNDDVKDTGNYMMSEKANQGEIFSAEFIRSQEELWRQYSTPRKPKINSPRHVGKEDKFTHDNLSYHHEEGRSRNGKHFAMMTSSTSSSSSAVALLNSDSTTTNESTIVEDFSKILEDPVDIEEQRQILDQIQKEQHDSIHETVVLAVEEERRDCPRRSKNTNSIPFEHTTTDQQLLYHYSYSQFLQAQNQQDYDHCILQQRQVHPSYSSKNHDDDHQRMLKGGRRRNDMEPKKDHHVKDALSYHKHDRIIRMGDQGLKVKGTRHVYDSISNGSAIIVQCSSCHAILQVGLSAKLLYCVNCQQITPVEISQNISASLIGVTDREVAKSVQMQEVEVACCRKRF